MSQLDNPVIRFFIPPARLLAIISGWWMLALSLLTCVEIVLRKFFAMSIQGIDEIGAYTLAIVSAFGFASALMVKAHTRVDFLVGRLPAFLRALLNAAAYVLLAAMAGYAAWRGWAVLDESLEFQAHANSPLQTPLWIPQSAWLAGIGLFAASSGAMAAHALLLLLTSWRQVNRYYGPLTLDEEIETEVSALKERGGVEGAGA